MKWHPLLIAAVYTLLVTACIPSTALTREPASQTPTPTPVFDITLTDIVNTVKSVSSPRVHSSHLSPDNKWRVEIITHDCVRIDGLDPSIYADTHAYEQIELINVDTGSFEVLDSQYRSCGGLGAYGFGGLFWSENSRYFYYTNAREGQPDGCGYWERPLMRLGVSNRKTEYLGGGTVSPDGTKLATWQDRELVVWDINQNEMSRVSAAVKSAEPGSIVWSPNSQALVYVQIASFCPISGMSYIVHIAIPRLEQNILIESETPTFGEVGWSGTDQLSLVDENGEKWSFDLSSKELNSSTSPTLNSGMPLLTNEDEGFALRYPAEYHVVLFGRSMCFTLAQIDGIPSACHVASAILDVSDAKGRTLANIADEIAANANPTIEVTRTNMKIDGEEAILLDDIYTFDVLRKLAILHNNRVYIFTFLPWASGTEDFKKLQNLYSVLTESFTFLE